MAAWFNRYPAVVSLTVILVFCYSAPAKTNGGYAGAFLRMGLGAEAVAQGDAFTARACNGFAAYYNPAGLSHLKRRTFATSYSNLALDRSLNFIGLTFPLKPTAGLALGWVNAGVTNIDGRDYDGNHYGTLSFHENAFFFAFSNQLSKYVSAGIGVKVLYGLFPKMLDDDKALKATGVGFDFGMLIKPIPKLQFGFQVREINSKYGWDTSEFWAQGTSKNDEFPSIYKGGVAFFPTAEMSVEYDLEVSEREALEHHFGLEYSVIFKSEYVFMLRSGYDHDVPAFGFGFMFPLGGQVSKLDIAYIMENISPRDTMIFSWTLLF